VFCLLGYNTVWSDEKSTDISEENSASIFRVEELNKQETSVKLVKAEVACSSKVWVDF
jgi:hypothetical protein